MVQLQREATGVSVMGNATVYRMKPQWQDPLKVRLAGTGTDMMGMSCFGYDMTT